MSSCVLGSVQIKNVCVLPLTQINPPSGENVLVKVDPYLFKYKDEIDLINNIDEFRDFILTRLIDPKSRQVIRDYPLLRYLFNKYLNLCNLNDCEDLGNRYNYDSLQNFIELIGDYWIELVEQLVPSTSIWKGATRFYRNTIFDQPKFKYKNYSLLTCNSNCYSIIPTGYTICETVFGGGSIERLNTSYNKTILNKKLLNLNVINCWKDILNIDTQQRSELPSQILECVSSTGKSIDLITLSVNGELDGATLFNEIVKTGKTINDISGLNVNSIISSIMSGFTNIGYTTSYSGESYYIKSPTNSDCGKQIDLSLCYKLDLSCVSGGTSYPEIYSGSVNTGVRLQSDADLCAFNNSIYILDSGNARINVLDCSTNSVTTNIGFSLFNLVRIKYNSNNNLMYFLYGTNKLGVIDCSTNTIINTITLTFINSSSYLTYNSINNTIYITDDLNNKIYVYNASTLTIINSIDVSGYINKPTMIEFNSIDNKIYCLGNILNGGNKIIAINCVDNTIINNETFITSKTITDIKFDDNNNRLFITTNVSEFYITNTNLIQTNLLLIEPNTDLNYSIEYSNTYNFVYISRASLDGSKKIFIFDLNSFTNIGNISIQGVTYSRYITQLIYNSTENLLYLLNSYGVTDIIEGLYSSTNITTSCDYCYNFYSSQFESVDISGNTEVYDCTKCVGLNDEGVEVIIETIKIPTGTTEVSCVENNNKIKCSEIFIKSINDDVTFLGSISIKKQ